MKCLALSFLFTITLLFMLIASLVTPATADNHCGHEGQKICGDGIFKRHWCARGLRGVKEEGNGTRCRAMDRISEPTTNVNQLDTKYQTQTPGQPLRGYADIHAHMFANQAFGGLVVWGQPFSFGGVNRALPPGDFSYHVDPVFNILGVKHKPADTILGKPIHGSSHSGDPFTGDPIGKQLHDGAFSKNNGIAPSSDADGGHDFTGWPKWKSTTHQQMYYKWLERAYQGGQRLMVMFAVNNEVLCKIGVRENGRDCKQNMQDIDIQISNAYLLQTYVDLQSGGPGKGWFRIVTSPAQAREVIEDGKMAVVLGIETDSMFNCKKSGDCTNSFIRSELEKYYNRGVRHIFPIHDFDNEFGGAATFQDAINAGNKIVRGKYFNVWDCSDEGYNFKFDPNSIDGFTLFLLGGGITKPNYPSSYEAHCNVKGLTPKGVFLMNELMDKGMVIDIDHMSALGAESALQLAEARNYPLVASHLSVVEQSVNKQERDRTIAQLERIKDLGGMVGVGMFKGGDRNSVIEYDDDNNSSTPAPVPNDCGNSNKVFAQHYLRTVKTMKPSGVALGSDFNGMTQHSGPRFGTEACTNPATGVSDGSPQTNRVQYPFTIPGFGSFDKQVTGDRTFDFNTDGLAHVGLIPDFLADLKNIGLSDADIDPLFNSAESYIQMWERAEAANDTTSPVITAPADITVNNDPGKATAVVNFVAASATDDSGSVTVTQTGGPASGSAFLIGNTTVSWEAVDLAGNTVSANMMVTVVDNEFPAIVAPANITVSTDAGKATAVVTFTAATATDNSGSVTVTQTAGPVSGTVSSLGETQISWEAEDPSGNIAQASMIVTVEDNESPVINTTDISIEATGPQMVLKLDQPSVSDNVGVISVSSNAPFKFPVGTTTVTWTAKDAAGNKGTATQTIIVTDTTPPAVTAPADVSLEATGSTTPVTLGVASAIDLVDGTITATASPTGPFSVGTHTVTWSATDAKGNKGTATQMVIVTDTTPPSFDLNKLVTTIWPVNKRMVDAATISNVSDLVDANPSAVITITSNQSISGSDWKVVGDTASVKADRSGKDGERVYTITAKATDSSGNSSSDSVDVVVPHDQGQNKGGKKK